MTSVFNSTLSWLDSTERERRAVLELVSALNEPGTLDELGIGSIRDTIADALFPGTSTIQTGPGTFCSFRGYCGWLKTAPVRSRSSGPSGCRGSSAMRWTSPTAAMRE